MGEPKYEKLSSDEERLERISLPDGFDSDEHDPLNTAPEVQARVRHHRALSWTFAASLVLNIVLAWYSLAPRRVRVDEVRSPHGKSALVVPKYVGMMPSTDTGRSWPSTQCARPISRGARIHGSEPTDVGDPVGRCERE